MLPNMKKKVKPHRCIICGETNPEKFYWNFKSYCIECHCRKNREKRRDGDNREMNNRRVPETFHLKNCLDHAIKMQKDTNITKEKRKEYIRSEENLRKLIWKIKDEKSIRSL